MIKKIQLILIFCFLLINFLKNDLYASIIIKVKVNNEIITTIDLEKEADNLDNAVQKVLDDGLRTKDILSKGKKEVSTDTMGTAIIACLQK